MRRMDCIICVPTVWAGAVLGVRSHGRGLGTDPWCQGQCLSPLSLLQPPITTSTSSSSFSQVCLLKSLSCGAEY